MDSLPPELVDILFSYLSVSSIKALRKTCKSFAGIGEAHLFQDFEFRLRPRQAYLLRLRDLSRHATIAPRVKCLSCVSGVQLEYADYRYWKASVYQEESSKFSRGITSDGITQETYRRFHTALESRFAHDMGLLYERYRMFVDEEATIMADPKTIISMKDAFERLVNVSMVKIVMCEPLISIEDVADFDPMLARQDSIFMDPRLRVHNRRTNCLLYFLNFLRATQMSMQRLSDFAAISMPRELLVDGRNLDAEIIDTVFETLQHLDLQLSEFPHSDWLSRAGGDVYHRGRNLAASRMAQLLNRPQQLRSLSLEFPPGKEAEYSFEIFDRTNIDRVPRSWLTGLESISLTNFRCTLDDLEAFLQSAWNVNSLTLRNCHVDIGSMVPLLHALRRLQLQYVCIDGSWSVLEDEGTWHFHNEANFTGCSSSCYYEGPYASEGLRQHVETFILQGGDCPLPLWTSDGQEDKLWELEGDTSCHYLPWHS